MIRADSSTSHSAEISFTVGTVSLYGIPIPYVVAVYEEIYLKTRNLRFSLAPPTGYFAYRRRTRSTILDREFLDIFFKWRNPEKCLKLFQIVFPGGKCKIGNLPLRRAR